MKLIRKLKASIKRLLCQHPDVELVRWCIKHIPDYEPSCVVIEYRCLQCGKYLYEYRYGKDKDAWIRAMGYEKYDAFCETR